MWDTFTKLPEKMYTFKKTKQNKEKNSSYSPKYIFEGISFNLTIVRQITNSNMFVESEET